MAAQSNNPVVSLTDVFKMYKVGEVDVPAAAAYFARYTPSSRSLIARQAARRRSSCRRQRSDGLSDDSLLDTSGTGART
jgi:hypothetical protein